MLRRMTPLLALLCALVAPSARPADSAAARIVAIEVEGNAVTREAVILRELPVAVGDTLDAAVLEAVRASVLDLGLFRAVEAESLPRAEGVALRIVVREKRYFLPIPRLDANSDGDTNYGAQIRWDNLGGINHSLNMVFEQGTFPNDQQREKERTARADYSARRLAGSKWSLRGRLEYEDQDTPLGEGSYAEEFHRASLLATRDLTTLRPRRGWIVGGGLEAEEQSASGELAPPDDGFALAALATADFDDLRYRVYSETGTRLSTRLRGASSGLGSDYGFARFDAAAFHARDLGARPHQSLQLLGAVGVHGGGPDTRNRYTLGGSGALRGYEPDFLEGDAYYYGAIEYLRPIRWDWLRLLVALEAGGADRANPLRDYAGAVDGSPYGSIAVGLRIRIPIFVNVEIEAGVALPLRGGDGARFFAGGN